MIKEPNSINELLSNARDSLKHTSDSPALDAELLLAHCLKKERSYLYAWPEKELNEKQLSCFKALISKRLTDYPVAYILGTKAFWTLDIMVTPDVLIPRPETELLVETALEKIKLIKQPNILDLGTGSGAIALALASERKDAKIIASDKSQKALDVAQHNAKNLHLASQIKFQQSNWYSNIDRGQFDLIVSNPPYIEENDPHLEQTIRYEPKDALVAKNKGLMDIETIINQSRKYLKKNGYLLIEHGYTQGYSTLQLFLENNYADRKTLSDINALQRVSLACYSPSQNKKTAL